MISTRGSTTAYKLCKPWTSWARWTEQSPWPWTNYQRSGAIWCEMTSTGKIGILPNWPKRYAFGRAGTQSVMPSQRTGLKAAMGNRLACIKPSRQEEDPEAVHTVTPTSTRRPTAWTSSPWRNGRLASKKLCFNCTGSQHRAADCKSTATCKRCQKRHHTSICDSSRTATPEGALTAHQQGNKEVVYPIVLVEIDGIRTHALLDTGAGSSYASANLISALKKRPKETVTKRIDMMLGSSTTKVQIYSATLGAVGGGFSMNIELSKVNKPQLLTLDKPNYATLLSKYKHLKGVKIEDSDNHWEIPVHVVLGASEYAAVKTTTAQRVGKPGKPVAERTLLGWTVMTSWRSSSRETPQTGISASYLGKGTTLRCQRTKPEARDDWNSFSGDCSEMTSIGSTTTYKSRSSRESWSEHPSPQRETCSTFHIKAWGGKMQRVPSSK